MSGSAHGAEPEAVVETALHRAPAECKVAATLVFALAVALVPRGDVFWPYAIDAALLAVVAVAARTSPRLLAGRLAIEAPFEPFLHRRRRIARCAAETGSQRPMRAIHAGGRGPAE